MDPGRDFSLWLYVRRPSFDASTKYVAPAGEQQAPLSVVREPFEIRRARRPRSHAAVRDRLRNYERACNELRNSSLSITRPSKPTRATPVVRSPFRPQDDNHFGRCVIRPDIHSARASAPSVGRRMSLLSGRYQDGPGSELKARKTRADLLVCLPSCRGPLL